MERVSFLPAGAMLVWMAANYGFKATLRLLMGAAIVAVSFLSAGHI